MSNRAAGSTPRRPQPTQNRWPLIVVTMFAAAYGGNEFTPLLVFYKGSFSLSSLEVNAVLGAYIFGLIPALLIAGPLSDRIGRRTVMLPAVPISLIGSAILALGAESTALMVLGRVCSGIALGIGMTVGTTWIKELADLFRARPGVGAQRASLTLTTGFLIGALVASVLVQWGPHPQLLPYAVHIALCVAAAPLPLWVPETHRNSRAAREERGLLQDLVVPELTRRRFLTVILPLAPWIFTSATAAFGVLPTLMATKASHAPVAFAGLLTVVTLSCATGIQMVGRRLDTPRSARASIVSLSILTCGMALASWASAELTFPLIFTAAAVLGIGQGIGMLGGLSEVQRLAGPANLAGLTSVFYSAAYLGFLMPFILAWLHTWFGYPQLFAGLAAAVAACTALVVFSSRRDLEHREAPRAR